MSLLNIDSNAKTVKGEKFGYLTGIIYFAPAKLSGTEMCSHRTAGCTAACLNTSGMGSMDSVQQARIKKTRYFLDNKTEFLAELRKDINSLMKRAHREGLIPCVRLNGTSDYPWEITGIIQEYPILQFYDYTKNPKRMVKYLSNEMPKNYHLTFSASEDNIETCEKMMELGGNVAMVFDEIPTSFRGRKVINGDESDLRFLDELGVIVGLKMKGRAKKDTNGFVYKQEPIIVE